MPIHAPGRVLLTRLPLASVRKRWLSRCRPDAFEPITLPLIDILLVLTFFLLQFFDARGSSCPERHVQLPEAKHGSALALAPVITIDASHVTLDGRRMVDSATLLAAPSVPIAPLIADLETLRRNYAILRPGEAPPDHVLIRAERQLPYRLLRSVLASSSLAGYPSASFVVEQSAQAVPVVPE
jgi:biopolymer transport protein ExbD